MTYDHVRRQLVADLPPLAEELDVPGASIALAFQDRAVVEAGCGVINTRTGVPVTADALFQIQSITKIFTATLVMQLVDDGLVQLDDRVRVHLPDFRTEDAEASERITVRHLLTHTGGFEGDLWQPTTDGPDALARFVSDLVPRARQRSEPGRHFSYCNAGFGVLGRLVEVARGTVYEQALRHFLLEPLGIDEVAFSAEQALTFRTAIGHVRSTASAALRPTGQWSLTPPSNPAAGNQLAMSARGLLALGRLFLSRGSAPDGTRLLSTASAGVMLRPHLQQRPDVPAPSFQGLGWRLPRPGIAEHGGGMPGVAALLVIAPDHDLAAVVLTNSDNGARLARRLLDPVLTELAGVPPLPALPTPEVATGTSDSAAFIGRYSTRQASFDVNRDDQNRLWLTTESRHEAAAMDAAEGIESSIEQHEIRRLAGGTFTVIDDQGSATRTITFLDRGPDGRYRLLATERTASRDDH